MEIIDLASDIHVFYITATSFPGGVEQAHRSLQALVPFDAARRYFGFSHYDQTGAIIYKAAGEELEPGEFSRHGLETFTFKQGRYRTIMVKEMMKHLPDVGKAFQQLISEPDIDPKGVALEWYTGNGDCQCMVRLADR